MKVIYTTGFLGEIHDDLTENLYSEKHMSKSALYLLKRRMDELGIISFEDKPGHFVSIGSVQKQIEQRQKNR